MFAATPRPGPLYPIAQVDFVGAYEHQMATQVVRTPEWAADRDPIFLDMAKRAQRAAACSALLGSVRDTWVDVLHHAGQQRFIPAFLMWLSIV